MATSILSGLQLVAITTRNEADTIGPLVKRLRALGYQPVVVDDNSEDGTAAQAERAGAWVYAQEPPSGLGPGLVQAWHHCLRWHPQTVVQMDAGGSHRPEDIGPLVEGLAHWDLVLGSRFLAGSAYRRASRDWWSHWYRPIASRAMSGLCRALFQAPWSDWTSGFRAFRPAALARLAERPYRCRMHGWQIEVLAHAMELGLAIGELPIQYQASRSALRPRWAWEALRLALERSKDVRKPCSD